MILVVSSTPLDLQGSSDVLVVSSLTEALRVVGYIDALIIHTTDEDETTLTATLAQLKERGFGSLWYVRTPEHTDVLLKMVVVGSGGFYVEDEFFLEDSELLRSLLDEDTSSLSLTTLGGTGVLEDFTSRYLNEDSTDIPKGYLQVLSNAVSQIVEGYEEKSQQLLVLSERATEVMEDFSVGLKEIGNEKENLKKIVTELEEAIEQSDLTSQRSNSVAYFPRVNYRKEKDIIRIKDIGRTPFLFSFTMGFLGYCEKVLNKRPKLIVVEPVGMNYTEQYANYTWITSETTRDTSRYFSNIVFTNHPTSTVISSLLEDRSKDTFIVLDRTATMTEHILNSRTTRSVRYALSSSTYKDSMKLKDVSPRTIFFTGLTPKDGFDFYIPLLDYPENPFARENLYLNECGGEYAKLFRKG